MAKQGDITRPRSVKAKFDGAESGTGCAGAVLIEKTLRGLNLKRMIHDHLPKRAESSGYSTFDVAYPFIAGMMVGGRGMIAAESLRLNSLDQEIFGLEKSLPTEGTIHNAFADMSGLSRRKFDDVYVESGVAHPSMDLLGDLHVRPARRRTVPQTPESARTREGLDDFTAAVARRCLATIPHGWVKQDGYTMVFGDATQLEVEGRCFDVAETDRNGARALQWATLMVGPVIVAQSLGGGASFEAARLEGLIKNALGVVRDVKGPRGVLGLYDAAYYHERVINQHEELGWKYIICANLHRARLQSIVSVVDDALWSDLGPDDRRGWVESGIYVFRHRPGDWKHESHIVVVRWREQGDLPGLWRYSFFATNLAPSDLPKSRVADFGYGQYVRMLYGTKQGREVHYKTALQDFGLHHPPSGRLGINEVFFALAVAAVNVAMVIRYRVLKGKDRRMSFWRFRERYVRLSGRVKRGAATLTCILFGASVDSAFQVLWLSAFAEAGRL